MDAPIFDHPLLLDPREICKPDGAVSLECHSAEFNKVAEGVEIEGVLRVEAQIVNYSAEECWLNLSYSGQQVLTCSRSLEKFVRAAASEFVLKVIFSDEVKEWEFLADQEDESVLKVNSLAKGFSVFEAVRQEIILNEPMNPIKNPEEDFEWKDPSEKEEKIDPRWAKLLELRNKIDKE